MTVSKSQFYFHSVLEQGDQATTTCEIIKANQAAEIAFLLGYSDQANFSNAFKSWYGMPPSEYLLKPNL